MPLSGNVLLVPRVLANVVLPSPPARCVLNEVKILRMTNSRSELLEQEETEKSE